MMRPHRFVIAILFFLLNLTGVAFGQTPAGLGDSKAPLEVTADGSLEWNRAARQFIARENAKAVQGQGVIEAQTLTALYRESDQSAIDIYEIKAARNVILRNQDSAAYGDNGFYDLDKGYAELTGKNLKLVSPGQTIIAQERFEYWVNDGRAIAIGAPRVIRPKPDGSGQDTLDAETIIATFKDNNAGVRVIDTLEAKDNVVITTPAEIMTGAYGIYRASTNKAELSGGVTITRGLNVLEGERAIVNLTTNVSQIFSGSSSSSTQSGRGGRKRVRGVFYPDSRASKTPSKAPVDSQLQTP